MGLQSMMGAVLRDRHRLPRFVNLAIDHVADHPDGFWGRLAVRATGPVNAADIPAPTPAPDAPVRVYIGPTNYAGQGHEWAQALTRSSERIGAANMAVDVPGGFSFEADTVVPTGVYARSAEWQRAELDAVTRFSHVLFEAERPLFGRLFGRDVRREAAELRSRGLSIAMIGHGTDVRVPSRHAAATPWSPFLDDDLYTDKLERDAIANIALLRELGASVFVSTPDLLDDVPWADWCPVVVDLDRWSLPRASHDGPLRVVHAPSKTKIKGTHLIEPVLERLHAEGVIAYRRIEGVPHAEMPGFFSEADVVLDQFRLGSYGVAACEAMAAGCVTVAHLLPHVREHIERATGGPAPLVEATPDSLETVLRGLAADGDRRAALVSAGRDFVRLVHDGRMSAEVLRAGWIDRADG
ncbi:hypothetical protein ACFVAJ_01790 [Agromyces sp. NPDC057679]|uniref:hypothetical protein n=1 Tax=Agromyces sp. NPDC057679 TaxID=3346207 RepID=UPI0036705F25